MFIPSVVFSPLFFHFIDGFWFAIWLKFMGNLKTIFRCVHCACLLLLFVKFFHTAVNAIVDFSLILKSNTFHLCTIEFLNVEVIVLLSHLLIADACCKRIYQIFWGRCLRIGAKLKETKNWKSRDCKSTNENIGKQDAFVKGVGKRERGGLWCWKWKTTVNA